MNRYKIMRILALGGSIIAAIQAIIGFIYGSLICLNDGCRVVEGLSAVPPQVLNLMGFIFFQAVFWSLLYQNRRSISKLDLPGLLLICGLAFDSALLAYQVFAARVFCSYCLLIFVLVLILNLLYNRKQMAAGMAIFGAILIAFSVLTVSPAGARSQTVSLKSAAYGVKSCSSPTKEVYLIFSSSCPHCQEVLETLNNCNSCDLYLNPIEDVQLLNMAGLALNENFSPEVNRLALSVLGIESVPVLVVRSQEGYRFIKGESGILDYVRRACFTHDEILYFDRSFDSDNKELTALTEEDGECSVAIDCSRP